MALLKRLTRKIQSMSNCKLQQAHFNSIGFTLIELLVVMAIISMLAGELLPALSTAREKGRQANCISNLKQFSISIEIYFQDYKDYPPWLSTLYPSYMSSKGVYTCLTDMYAGERGHGHKSFPETNDIPPPNIPNTTFEEPYLGAIKGFNYRNSEIDACSYFYEFNYNRCSWFHSSRTPEEIIAADSDNDGIVTWKEAKIWQMQSAGLGGKVPIVRCFWHHNIHKQKVLNLSAIHYNVFTSGPEWESSSY
ncbi:prepilin-type N-terminal cleavage/methylation domain-containing protein [bacterium]|nr:prepilin-type N-terminal cleavage/methylation domain-containing protein [bacterium]